MEDIRVAGGNAVSIVTEIINPDGIAAMAALGSVGIRVENACRAAGLLHCDKPPWGAAQAVNITGSWLCYKAVLTSMRKARWGRYGRPEEVSVSRQPGPRRRYGPAHAG